MMILASCNLQNNATSDKKDKLIQEKSNLDKEVNSPINLPTKSELKKCEEIHKSLRNKGIYSYFKIDTLYIYDNKDNAVTKLYLKPPSDLPNLNRQIDTMYEIKQHQNKNILFLALQLPHAEYDLEHFFILDLKSKKVLVNLNDNHTNYIGSSSDGKYHAFDVGTSACERFFIIRNSENKTVKEDKYFNCIEDTNKLKWFGNKIYYYGECNKNYTLPKTQPKLKEQEVNVQKYYWSDGKDSITKEFSVAGIE